MKLKQNEFCHNCQQYVDFAFDDVTERQVIICPNCRHEHWRELDEGTIINIRLSHFRPGMVVAEFPPLNASFVNEDDPIPAPVPCKTHEVIGIQDGKAIVKNGDGKKTKTISERRWGRDPNQ